MHFISVVKRKRNVHDGIENKKNEHDYTENIMNVTNKKARSLKKYIK